MWRLERRTRFCLLSIFFCLGTAGSALAAPPQNTPGKQGELLNLRETEQRVDQLNRLPSNQAQMELALGKAVGGSDVLIKNTRKSSGVSAWHFGTIGRYHRA